jgi:hypothetical protein
VISIQFQSHQAVTVEFSRGFSLAAYGLNDARTVFG